LGEENGDQLGVISGGVRWRRKKNGGEKELLLLMRDK
jgi:hypothetical protein